MANKICKFYIRNKVGYTQTDSDELIAAQQMMVDAIFGAAGMAIQ